MGLFKIFTTVSTALLILVYSCLLVYIWKGSKSTFVMQLVGLLLVSNVMLLADMIYLERVMKEDPTTDNIWVFWVFKGIGDACYLTAHFLLAWKYRKVSNDIPKVLNNEPQENQ